MGKEALTLQGISKYYTSGQSVVMGLNQVDLTFRIGEFVAITGESGSGKSTMAKVMAGILPYESGEMLLFGRPTSHYDGSDWERYRSDSISFISQSYDILPGCTVLRNVVSALRLTGMDRNSAAVRAEEILREVELWDMRSRRAAKLSSGQMQRLSIARALAKPAPILIADEPTGNLDSENSAKVVQLLSAAAKDRLVIMITHEFDEVANHATRHITLQDSIVASDVPLRPQAGEREAEPVRKRTAPRGLSLYTGFLQIGSRPMWSTIMLLFFALTAFATFAFLGTFISNLDDTPTRVYDNSAFRNGDMERIVVVRSDGASMTEEEINRLLSVSHVVSAERYGLVTDINYFYRQDVDYFLHYSAVGNTFDQDATHVETQPTLEGTTLFVETVPVLREGETFLTGGRLPENILEVVAGDESLLGETFRLYIQDTKNWSKGSYLNLFVTVVGTTDYGDHLYFSDTMARSLSHSMLHEGLLIIPDDTLEDNTFLSSETLQRSISIYESKDDSIQPIQYVYQGVLSKWLNIVAESKFHFFAYGSEDDVVPLSYLGVSRYKMQHSIVVSPTNYEMLVEEDCHTQVCLTIEDYAHADEVLEELRAMGYGALSPFQLGSNKQNPTLAEERMQTLKVCLLALTAVILLQIVVLRAMFSMETEEYRLLANLGLRCKTAKRSVLWQIIVFSLGGELLGIAAIGLCGHMNIERIVSILRYLPTHNLLLIWAVHFGAGLLATAWITHALRRQVYPVSGNKADLNMEEEVEA